MGTKVDAPPPRDYGKETRDTLQAQIDLAPQLYAAESKYAPKYQDLQLQLLGRAAPELMGIYERDIFPSLSRMESDSMARQRAADIRAVQELGPQAREAMRAANPDQAALLDSMTAQAQAGIDAGSSLTPQQMRSAQQSSRAAMASRGLANGPNAILDEVLTGTMAGNAEQDRRMAQAANTFNLQRQAYGDPFQQILGRPSGTFAAAQGYGAQAQGFNPGQLFNPESQYASDLIGSNKQQQLAARTATAANQTALVGAGLQAAGSAAGAL